MPFHRREHLGGKEGGGKEGAVEHGVIMEGLEKISTMLSEYVREVERRIEVLEKMFFGLERRIAEVEGRVSLAEKKIEERFAEERAIRVPSSIVETVKAQPPSVAFAEKEEKKVLQGAAKAVDNVVEEEGEAEKAAEANEEWGFSGEGGLTSVVAEFKKLLSEDKEEK